jgi:hypothetical protein
MVGKNLYTAALKTAMKELPSENPITAARILFENKAITFIQAGGFAVHFPGVNQIGFEEIIRKYKINYFTTSDSPADDEEELLREKAYKYAQDFNDEMLSLLLKSGEIKIFEVEYEIIGDVKMELNYPSSTSRASLRNGYRLVIWHESPDAVRVVSGQVKMIRKERVTEKSIAAKRSALKK